MTRGAVWRGVLRHSTRTPAPAPPVVLTAAYRTRRLRSDAWGLRRRLGRVPNERVGRRTGDSRPDDVLRWRLRKATCPRVAAWM